MPANTPIYGFTYQCPGDTVDPADFATLGGQIDAVIAAQDTARNNALNRYNTGPLFGALQAVASGVEATLATPSYTFPVSGLWVVRGTVPNPGFATVNMTRVRIRHNATDYTGQTQNTEPNFGLEPWAATTLVATAGDTVQLRYLFNGAGPVNVFGEMTVRLLALRN